MNYSTDDDDLWKNLQAAFDLEAYIDLRIVKRVVHETFPNIALEPKTEVEAFCREVLHDFYVDGGIDYGEADEMVSGDIYDDE